MIDEVISLHTTISSSRAGREVYPEVEAYINQAMKGLIPLLKATEKQPKKTSCFHRTWMPPQPRPKLRDEHQLMLMIESALERALLLEGFNVQDILPGGRETFAFTIYWTWSNS